MELTNKAKDLDHFDYDEERLFSIDPDTKKILAHNAYRLNELYFEYGAMYKKNNQKNINKLEESDQSNVSEELSRNLYGTSSSSVIGLIDCDDGIFGIKSGASYAAKICKMPLYPD